MPSIITWQKSPCPLQGSALTGAETREKIKNLTPVEIHYSEEKQALLARTATFETFGYPPTINGEKNLIWFNAITKKHGDRDVLFYEFGCTPIDKD